MKLQEIVAQIDWGKLEEEGYNVVSADVAMSWAKTADEFWEHNQQHSKDLEKVLQFYAIACKPFMVETPIDGVKYGMQAGMQLAWMAHELGEKFMETLEEVDWKSIDESIGIPNGETWEQSKATAINFAELVEGGDENLEAQWKTHTSGQNQTQAVGIMLGLLILDIDSLGAPSSVLDDFEGKLKAWSKGQDMGNAFIWLRRKINQGTSS